MARKKEGSMIPREQRAEIIPKIQAWAAENLEEELSGLKADMLIDFLEKSLGRLCYNRAVEDCVYEMSQRADDLYLLAKEVELE
jgi:uncharacterized protein (DUF2164 family)